MRRWNLTLSPLSINQSTPRSCSSVSSFQIFRQNLCANLLSIAPLIQNRCRRTAKKKKLHNACPLWIFSVRICLVICFSHSLTCTMTLSRADFELWAERARSLHQAAPMVTVCPASGEPSVMAGTNLITLLSTDVQSKLRQLSHGIRKSVGKKRLIRRGRGGGGIKGRKE